jgi:hypothetical protein
VAQAAAFKQPLESGYLPCLMRELHVSHVVTIRTDETHHSFINQSLGNPLTIGTILPRKAIDVNLKQNILVNHGLVSLHTSMPKLISLRMRQNGLITRQTHIENGTT